MFSLHVFRASSLSVMLMAMKPATATAAELTMKPDACGIGVPVYLSRTYHWAYLNRHTLPWLDRSLVVSAILWGNAGRLMKSAVTEFGEGQHVLQAACVYGPFSRMLADRVGPTGALEVVDVAALQVANARHKLQDLAHVQVRQANLAEVGCIEPAASDAVCCFFLLHEVPDGERRSIVDNLMGGVRPGGKIVFVDYHRTVAWHPLRPIMALVFRWLEPYAPSLLDVDIAALSKFAADFEWKKTTCFGGLYQKLVGVRRG